MADTDTTDEGGMPQRTVAIHGHEVSYRRAGEGPAILLIHGMAGSASTWRDVMPTLAEHHDVIAPDLLGHGESAKPLGDYSLGAFAAGLRDFLGTIGVPRATIVGQSLGGGVAMQFAYQFPEMTERLVLVCSGGLGREVSWMLRALSLPGAELVMPFVVPTFVRDHGNRVSRFVRDRGINAPLVSEMWRGYQSLAETRNRHAFLRTLRAVVDASGQIVSAKDRLYLTAAMPSLIVWGDQDNIIPVSHAHTAHELMPGSRLEIFEGAGHFPHVQQPERFAELLADFIATTHPTEGGAEAYRGVLLAGGHEYA